MRSILMGLDSSRSYTEVEINQTLQAWKRDVAPAVCAKQAQSLHELFRSTRSATQDGSRDDARVSGAVSAAECRAR